MPLSQNRMSEISWLFRKMKTACQTYMKTKKFVEIRAIMA